MGEFSYITEKRIENLSRFVTPEVVASVRAIVQGEVEGEKTKGLEQEIEAFVDDFGMPQDRGELVAFIREFTNRRGR